MTPHLDRLDLQILSELQDSNQMTAHDLADRVPLSPSAIQRRIRNYRNSGVITADVSVVNPKVAGEQLSVVLLIQLAQQKPQAVAEFRAFLGKSPQVQVIMEIAGTYELMCIGMFDGIDSFNAFADTHVGDHPSVSRYETIFVRRRVKFGTKIPL
ncbi:Lrp/AsnC family transcriptional regulator [Phenylobacterium sp.]|uniref:Lrp/AsnC family transcriptional regulator n=1 Tax=Phenylobacterium sp. TaxID=1871053 RepID=UPI00286ADEDA|nr:Lrp/AsnC family transcriptional regulator [Phenylobacterium sp.]